MPESDLPAEPTKSAGQKLSEALRSESDPYEVALLVERAATTADWLERLDNLLEGRRDSWAQLRDRGGDITVTVDNALREARALSGELRHLLSDIHRRRGSKPPEPPEDDLAGLS